MVEIPYKALFEQNADAYILIDTDHRIVAVNAACMDLLSLTATTIKESVIDFIAPSYRAQIASQIDAVFAGKTVSTSCIFMHNVENPCAYQMKRLQDGDGSAYISVRLQDQQELHQSLLSLRIEQLKVYFLIGLHGQFEHQTNASLHAALGMLNLQYAGRFEPGNNKALDVVQRACEEVCDALQEQRAVHAQLGVLEQGDMHAALSLDQIISAATYIFEHQARFKHIRLQKHLVPMPAPAIESVQLFSMIFGVIEYALQRAETHLDLALRADEKMGLCLRVHCDTSVMRAEELAAIFTPYLHSEIDQFPLYVAKKIADEERVSLDAAYADHALQFTLRFIGTSQS